MTCFLKNSIQAISCSTANLSICQFLKKLKMARLMQWGVLAKRNQNISQEREKGQWHMT